MLRTVVRLTPTFTIPLFHNRNNELDCDLLNTTLPNTPKTGWDRVKKMYSMDDYGEVSVELHSVIQYTLCGGFFGACFGGFLLSKDAYLYFIQNNQATIFKSTIDAKKKLQNHVTVAFAKGAVHWGWRLAMFTGMFSLAATTLSVYKGNTSLVDFIMAGALAGGIYKANLGLAASLVGAGLGATLSTVGGLLILGVLKMTGFSMDEIRTAMYKIKQHREYHYNQAVEKSATIKNDEITKHHDMLVTEKGIKKVEELV